MSEIVCFCFISYSVNFSSQQEDALLTYLLDTELQAMSSIKRLSVVTPIGIARVKADPDLELSGIFQNKYVLDSDRFDVSFASAWSLFRQSMDKDKVKDWLLFLELLLFYIWYYCINILIVFWQAIWINKWREMR